MDSIFLTNFFRQLLRAALGKVEHEEPNVKFVACTWKQFSCRELDSCSDQVRYTCTGPLMEERNYASKKL